MHLHGDAFGDPMPPRNRRVLLITRSVTMIRGMGSDRSDPTRRFSDRVENYIRYRPGYPAEILDILRSEIGFDPTWTVADVGSGTGISTRMFLDHGNEVFAVE